MPVDLSDLFEIPVESISNAKFNLRSEISRNDLDNLIESIKEKGLLEPIIVRRSSAGYELIAGYRRLRAVRYLGHVTVAARVCSVTDTEAFEISIVENVQRQTLNPIDEAFAYKSYVETFGYGSVSSLAKKIGKSQEYVSTRLSFLKLPQDVIDKVISRQITPSAAQELLPLSTAQQRRIASLVVERRLTKRQIRDMVKTSTKEEFEGIAWLDLDSEVQDVNKAERRALDQTVGNLKVSLQRLSDITNSLPESSLLRDMLFELRRRIHRDIDSLIKYEKKQKLRS